MGDGQMRPWGYLLIAVGTVWLVIAFLMDTSVSISGGGLYGLPSRVENIGLIAQRQNHLFVSALIILIGVLLAIFGGPRPGVEQTAIAPVSPPPRPAAPENRDLDNDGYRLWLADIYQIGRNDIFDRFVMGDQTFGSLDDALAEAHERECKKLEAAAIERQQAEEEHQRVRDEYRQRREEEDAKWEEGRPKRIAAVLVTFLAILIASPFVFHWSLKLEEKRRIEAATKSAQAKKDAEAAGLPIMDDAKSLQFELVTGGDDATFCHERKGTLVTYETPKGSKDVAAFYDKVLKNGREEYDFSPSDSEATSRYYDATDGSQISLTTFGNKDASVYLCKES